MICERSKQTVCKQLATQRSKERTSLIISEFLKLVSSSFSLPNGPTGQQQLDISLSSLLLYAADCMYHGATIVVILGQWARFTLNGNYCDHARKPTPHQTLDVMTLRPVVHLKQATIC